MPILENKNISSTQYSLIGASVIAFSQFCISFFFELNIFKNIVFAVLFFLIAYFVFYTIIEKFLFRKIKLIYKFISQTKANYKEETLREIVPVDSNLENVREDVHQWANDHRNELEDLQQNDIFRKEFLMNLSHELKTPIFTVQSYIQTLLDGAINNPTVRDKFLHNANLGMERLSHLVADLDQITKLEQGIIPLNKEKFIIQDLVKKVFEEFYLQATESKIKLGIKTGCETNVEVFADKIKIKQVLVNLIANSIKYGNENGETTVGVYKVDDNNVYIEITDNGIGIAEENVLRVFERFYRTDKGRSRSVGGSGLGLAIVKHIIEAHGHMVSCRSTLGVGSSFGFNLDRA